MLALVFITCKHGNNQRVFFCCKFPNDVMPCGTGIAMQGSPGGWGARSVPRVQGGGEPGLSHVLSGGWVRLQQTAILRVCPLCIQKVQLGQPCFFSALLPCQSRLQFRGWIQARSARPCEGLSTAALKAWTCQNLWALPTSRTTFGPMIAKHKSYQSTTQSPHTCYTTPPPTHTHTHTQSIVIPLTPVLPRLVLSSKLWMPLLSLPTQPE